MNQKHKSQSEAIPANSGESANSGEDPFRSSAHVERYKSHLLKDALEIADLAVSRCQAPWMNVLQHIRNGDWEKALQAIPRLKFVSRDKKKRTPDCLPGFQERLAALVTWRETSGELQRERDAAEMKSHEQAKRGQERDSLEDTPGKSPVSASETDALEPPSEKSTTLSAAEELGLPSALVETYRLESTADEKLAVLNRHLDREPGATITDLCEGKILFVCEDPTVIEKHFLFRVLEAPGDHDEFRAKVLFSLSHQGDSICRLDKGQISRRIDDRKRAFVFTVRLTRQEIQKGLNPSAFGALLTAIRNVMNVQNATFTFSLEPIEILRREFFEKNDFTGGHKAALALHSRFNIAVQKQMREFDEQAKTGASRGESMAEKQTRDTARGLIISTANTAGRPLNDIIQGFSRLVVAEEEKQKGTIRKIEE